MLLEMHKNTIHSHGFIFYRKENKIYIVTIRNNTNEILNGKSVK